jgi:hypothetical protein
MNVEEFALIGGLIGGLGGCVAFLIKLLVVSKDERIGDLVDERDYWRDAAIAGKITLPDFEEWYLRRHPPQHR